MPRLLEWGIQLSADIPKVEEVHRESFVSDLIRSCTWLQMILSQWYTSFFICLLSSLLRYYADGGMAIFWKECDKHPALKLLDL